jgi:GAF domain-containing protein
MDKYEEAKLTLQNAMQGMQDEAFMLSDKLRVQDLKQLNILDTPRESEYDDLVRLAAVVANAPTSVITFVDDYRTWVKANWGTQLPLEMDRRQTICHLAIQNPNDVFVVRDISIDPRVKDQLWLYEQGIARFAVAVPILTSGGNAVGAVCVLDKHARDVTCQQESDLRAISRLVSSLLSRKLN